jgi:hypothetical protein
MKKKFVFVIVFLFVITATSFQPIVKASIVSDSNRLKGVSEDDAINLGLCIEPYGCSDLPPEMTAKMSEREILELRAVPGYYKPKQFSVPSGQQMLDSNPQPVNAIVLVDEEMRAILAGIFHMPPELVPWDWVFQWAGNILEDGDDGLESGFGIDIQMALPYNWTTPDNWDYLDLLNYIMLKPPQEAGCDIMVLMTGQIDPARYGVACSIDAPDGGCHFVITCNTWWVCNLFQHEQSHNFGYQDMQHYGFGPFCIMNINWIAWTRDYCYTCTATIDDNKFRFD